MSEVSHVSDHDHGLDPARENELAVRVPAADPLVAFGALASKANLTPTINTGTCERMALGYVNPAS